MKIIDNMYIKCNRIGSVHHSEGNKSQTIKMPGRVNDDEYDRQLQKQREEIERAKREKYERERRVREREQHQRELMGAILRATGGRIPRYMREIF